VHPAAIAGATLIAIEPALEFHGPQLGGLDFVALLQLTALAVFGRLDVVVNNAGYGDIRRRSAELDQEPSVDGKVCTRDVGSIVREQERDGGRDFVAAKLIEAPSRF
jgi:NAD(P)-dependent dehydrogenase (short-subunit alcohol dehydrogenase family)